MGDFETDLQILLHDLYVDLGHAEDGGRAGGALRVEAGAAVRAGARLLDEERGAEVPLSDLALPPLPQAVDYGLEQGLGGVLLRALVAVLLHGVLQSVSLAGVTVEEAVLAEIVA